MKLPIITAIGISFLFTQACFADQTVNTQTTIQPKATVQVMKPTQNNLLTTEKEKVSYSIGADLGENFKAQGIEIDPAMVAKGLQDIISNQATLMTKQEMANTLMAFQKELVAKRDAQSKNASAQNLQAGNAYLAANKQKPGVITTASGLQYKIIKAGKGETPTANDTVTVDYKGTLINGKVFDSSYDRKQSVTFPVSGVVPGWQEALKLMQPGSTFEIVVPANLAYGEQGAGGAIGPNETLLFTIHLVSVKKTA